MADRASADALRPANVTEAHAIQDATTKALGKPAEALKAMARANAEANRGVLYADAVVASPAQLPAAQVPQSGVAGEVAFQFRRDLRHVGRRMHEMMGSGSGRVRGNRLLAMRLRRASKSFQQGMAARVAERPEHLHRARDAHIAAQRQTGTALMLICRSSYLI